MANTALTQFQIRKIPREVWALAKARATREQRSMQAVLLTFVEAYAKGPNPPQTPRTPR